MTIEHLKLISQTVTNLVVVGVVAAAWLTDKASPEAALMALLTVSGVQYGVMRSKNPDQLPPAGPTGLAMFMAAESLQHIIG